MAIRRVRSFWLAAAVCALVAWAAAARRVPAASAQAAAQPDTRPNVVVVLVDDMGWSDIGPFGSEIATPNLDALAARGVRFTQFYATPRCSPTRASLLTGLYSHQAGMGHLDNVIRRGSRRHDRAPQRSVRHDGRSASRRGLLHRDVGQVASWPGQRHAAVGSRLRTHAEPARRRHVLSESELHRRRQPAHEPRAGAAVSERRGDAARCARLRLELVRHVSLDRVRPQVHRRGASGQQAVLPVSSVQRAAFSVDGSGGTDRQVPRQVQGRLGPDAAGALSAADPNGAHRREVAAESARAGHASLGLALRSTEGSVRPPDGGLCRDDRGASTRPSARS